MRMHSQLVQVHSTTRTNDLCLDIARRLELRRLDGFALFHLADQLRTVPNGIYLFDYIKWVSDCMRKNDAAEVGESFASLSSGTEFGDNVV